MFSNFYLLKSYKIAKNTTTNKYEIFLQDFRKLSYCPRETSFPPKKFLYKAVTNTLGYVSFSNTWNGANMNVPITGDKNGTLVRDLDQLVVKDVNGNVVKTYPEEFGDYELIRPAHMKKCFQRYTPEQCCKPGDVGCYGSSSCAGDEAWNATEKDASDAARPNSNKVVATTAETTTATTTTPTTTTTNFWQPTTTTTTPATIATYTPTTNTYGNLFGGIKF